jgi:hypothetical protein
MSSPSREHLLGYLLGALEHEQHEQVESELSQNDTLRSELNGLRARMQRIGLDHHPEYLEAPVGLASRTCLLVAQERERKVNPKMSSGAWIASESSRRMSWTESWVAAAVVLVAASLFFPALSYSRFQSQVAACQNQLRLIGFGLHGYSELQPDSSFPGPAASGNRSAAGIVAPMLISHQLVPRSRAFFCPAARQNRGGADPELPTLEAVDLASGKALAVMQRAMGGDYGFNFGYTDNGQLVRPRNASRPDFVLAGDAPSNAQRRRVSANHRGQGQNVLYEDGHLRFVNSTSGPQLPDDPFHNRKGWVAAGVDSDDAVLGASADPPLPPMLFSDMMP